MREPSSESPPGRKEMMDRGSAGKLKSPTPGRIDMIAQVLGDECRRQLLKFLVVARRPLSGSEAARALLLDTQKLNREFKALENARLVYLADNRRARGFTEKLFMATATALDDPIVKAVLDATNLRPELAALVGPGAAHL